MKSIGSKARWLVCIYYVAIPLLASAQFHPKLSAVIYNVGYQKSSFKIVDAPNSEISSPSVTLIPYSIGFELKDSLNVLQVNYLIQNYRTPSPSWSRMVFPFVMFGPNYNHSLELHFLRIIQNAKRLAFAAGVGLSTTFIPHNKFDQNSVPNDSLFFGRRRQFDNDYNLKYQMDYYDRFVTSIYCTLNAKLVADLKVSKRVSLMWAAIYRQGLWTMFKSDYWIINKVNDEKGSGQMISRGTAYGFEFGMKYNFRK